MSNTVWPFTLLRPYKERETFETTRFALDGGHESRRAEFGTYGQLRVDARVRLPYAAKTLTDWAVFIRAVKGGYDSFLYKALQADHRTQTLEAVGTGTGSLTTFSLDMRHVDASTLLVYKAGVLQTLTTHYTVSGNNTAPLITFLSAPSNGQAITATYDYYHPVTLVEGGDDQNGEWLHDTGADATRIVEFPVTFLETYPGARRA